MYASSIGHGIGPGYLNAANAARYVGYSPATFRQIASRCSIPRYGPHRNRYRVADLDAFMADPDVFISRIASSSQRRTGFRPVRI